MVNVTKKALASGAVVCLALSAGVATTANAAVTRLNGTDRFDTASKIVSAGWANGATNAILASGLDANRVDALTVAPLAKKLDAPVVLVDPASSTDTIVAKFTALNAKTVYVANGSGVISDAVVNALSAKGITVTRLGGLDRYQTALNIAKALAPTSDSIVVANGDDSHLVDSLSIASIAAEKGMPIFLTDGTSFDASVKAYIDGLSNVKNSYVLGGSTLVSDSLYNTLPGHQRLAGTDRYSTNAAVINAFKGDSAVKFDNVYVASGEDANLIDALAGAALAAKNNGTIVLAHDSIASDASALLNNVVTIKTNISILGGTGAVTSTVETGLNTIQAQKTSPTVASVSTDNLKEIKVVYNAAVDNTTATNLNNYKLYVNGTQTAYSWSPADSASLQADGKTVVITLGTILPQQSSNSLTVNANAVKTTAGTYVATATNSFGAFDTTAPTPVSATLVGPTTLRVTFSEPVQVGGTFTLDNNTYSVGTAVAAANGDTHSLDVPLNGQLPAGSHTLTIAGTSDYANFKVNSANLTFNYALDTTAPTVSIVSAAQNKVVLKFSKVLNATTVANLSVYHTYNNNANYKGSVSTTDNQTFTVMFNGNYVPLGNATLYVNAGVDTTNVAKDLWGNAFASTSLTTNIVADNTAPAVTSVTAVDATHIDVKYSKEVTGANLTSNYTLKDSTGTAVAVTGAVADGNDDTIYHLTTATLNGGSYSLAIANIKDTTLAQNAMAAYSTTLSVNDTVAPTVNASGTTNASGNTATKIQIDFSEAMRTSGAGSILDLSNYQFNNTALPTGTTAVAANSGKSVIITLPSATTIAGVPFTVGRVADLAGNFTTSFSNAVTLAAGSVNTATNVVSGSIKAINATTVTFEVNQPLTAIDVNKFTIGGHAVLSAGYANQKVNNGATDGALVTVTVQSADKWAANGTPTISYAAGAFTTAFGIAASADSVTAVDATSPALVSDVVSGTNTITLTYNENINPSTVSIYTYTVANNTVTNVATGTNTVTLTLGTALTGTDATASLTQALEIKDMAGNKLAPSAAIAVTDGQAATVTSSIAGDSKSVTFNFSEAMKASTLVAGNFTLTSAGNSITGVNVSSDNKSVTVSFANALVTNDTLQATTAITDAAGNAIAATTVTK